MRACRACLFACVEVWSGVCPASNLCFGFFNFSPIWGGQVGHCLLHDLGNLCQKRICTVDCSKYVYEEATMATVWCSPGPGTGGIVLSFIYLFAVDVPSFKCIQMKMQNRRVGAQLMCSHSTDIMQEIIFSPVIFYIQLSIICMRLCNMLTYEPQYLSKCAELIRKRGNF